MPKHAATIRSAVLSDAKQIATVHVLSWREAYAGLLPDRMLSDLSIEERTRRWTAILAAKARGGEGLAFLASKGSSPLGFVSVGPQREIELRDQGFTGEIEALYVLEAAQRSGIGESLLRQAMQSLLAAGRKAAALWVLEDNHPARAFYEAMGARPVGSREDPRPDALLKEVAYGWDDLSRDVRADRGARTG